MLVFENAGNEIYSTFELFLDKTVMYEENVNKATVAQTSQTQTIQTAQQFSHKALNSSSFF